MALLPQAILQLAKPNTDGLMTPLAFGVAYFYKTGTTTPLAVYQDSEFGVAHGTSVTADADGKWPAIWLNPALGGTRMKVIEAGGDLDNPFIDVDPLNVFLGLGGVTNDYLANAPSGTLKGNLTGVDAPVDDYDQDEVSDFIRYATETDAGVVHLASSAEAEAGTDDSKAVTPAALADALAAALAAGPTTDFAFTFTATTEGKYIFPGGLIFQWFIVSPGDDVLGTYDFPFPFPNDCLGAMVSVKNGTAHTGGNGGGAHWEYRSKTQIDVGIAWNGSSVGVTDVSVWALGN